MNNSDNYLKVSKEADFKEGKEEGKQLPFFSLSLTNKLLTNSPEKVSRTTLIYDYIKLNPATTPYSISKKLSINQTDVHRCVRDLEFCSLILSKVVVENGHAKKTLFAIPPKSAEGTSFPPSVDTHELNRGILE